MNYFRLALSPVLGGYKTRNIKDINEPELGSILYCYLLGGACEHSGIYVGNNEIVHLNGDGLVEKVNHITFMKRLDGKNLAENIYVSCKGLKAVGSKNAAKAAMKLVGKRFQYSMLGFNCHAFTALCFKNSLESPKNIASSHLNLILSLPSFVYPTLAKPLLVYSFYDNCANKYDHAAKIFLDVDNWRIWDVK